MEDFSKKITFFRSLGQQENLETTPRNSVHRTSKLKIPDIFISSVSQKQTEAKQEYVEKKEPKIENKSPQLGKYISQSVGSHLNLLENERKPLTKSQSQEMFAVLEDEDNINGDKLPEKRDSAGLHKSKGFEDLPLAALKDESVIPKEEFPTPSEEPNNKPHVLNIIPKKIELHLSDDTTIEFRKRDNMLQPNRTQSLIEKRTNQEKNAELFIEKLRQIKDKRRSAEFNTPRTFLFDFTGRQDKSKSDNNLNTIVDTDNSKAEFQDQNNNEEVTKKDGLKIIPKEIRNRSMELDKQQENNEEALQIKVPTLEDITEKNKEIENSRYEEYVNVAEPIKIVIPVDSDIIINTEEENGNEITSEINGIVLETG